MHQMMRRALLRRQAAVATVACLCVVALVQVPPTSARQADLPADAPSCEQIRGVVLGQTDTWRIVRTGSPFDVAADPIVVACRLGVAGPARVRILGRSKVIDDQGEDSDTPSGGPYLTLQRFESGRAIMLNRTFSGPGVYDATGSISFVDLERGAQLTLSSDYRYTSIARSDRGRFHGLATVMTPAGSLAFAEVTEEPPAKRTTGPWTLWDAAGQRPARAALQDVTLSRGSAAAAAGLYYRDAAGAPARLVLEGAANTDAMPEDPALAWQSISLERIPKLSGSYNAELLLPPSTVALETTFGSYPQLEFSTSSDDPDAVVRILDEDQEQRLGTLAPGAYPHLKVIAGSPGVAFLLGRFSAHPNQRRVRVVSTSRKEARFFDVPARRGMDLPGSAVSSGDRQALADGNHLRFWVYPRGRVYRVPGVHDLALSAEGAIGLYSTDRFGRVEFRRGP